MHLLLFNLFSYICFLIMEDNVIVLYMYWVWPLVVLTEMYADIDTINL